jgi:hypothetical protein
MANRPSSSGRGSAAAGSRRRNPPPTVKKPFPWGTVLTAGVLGLFLVGILVYAVTNQGAGFLDPLAKADKTVPGVLKYKGLSRNHVSTAVQYKQNPPVGGNHNPVWENCAVYTAPIANEHAVHSLEHGSVWITYQPDLAKDQVTTLAAKVTGQQYRLLSPYPGLKTAVSLQAWGRQIFVSSASDPKVDKFLSAYTAGPQAPEPGSSCTGGTSATGPLPAAPTATTTIGPSPAASAAASPAATPSK